MSAAAAEKEEEENKKEAAAIKQEEEEKENEAKKKKKERSRRVSQTHLFPSKKSRQFFGGPASAVHFRLNDKMRISHQWKNGREYKVRASNYACKKEATRTALATTTAKPHAKTVLLSTQFSRT